MLGSAHAALVLDPAVLVQYHRAINLFDGREPIEIVTSLVRTDSLICLIYKKHTL